MPTLELVVNAQKAKQGYNEYVTGSNKAVSAGKKVDNSIKGITARMSSMGSVAKKIGGIVGGLFAGISGTMAVRSAIKTMASFEQTMAMVQGTTRATTEQFEQLDAIAVKMGITTRFSASQAAEGLLLLARGGQDVEQSIASLPHVLNLALVGVMDLGSSADRLTDILKIFRLEAEEGERVVDTLVVAANNATTDVNQLSEALAYGGLAAAGAGWSIEETAAVLGVLADASMKSTRGGTVLRGILAELGKPTDAAAAAIMDLVGSLDAVNPAMHSAVEIFQTFKDAGLDYQSSLEIFSRRSFGGALALTLDVEKLKETLKLFVELKGEGQRMADVIDNTLTGAWFALKSAIQSVWIVLGKSKFGLVIRDATDTMTDSIRILLGLSDAFIKNRDRAEEFMRVMGSLIAAASAFIALKFTMYFVGLAKAIWVTVTSLQALKIALISTGFGAIVVAIGSAVAALYYFKDEMVQIGEKTYRLGDIVRATFEIMMEQIVAWKNFITRFLSALWDEVANNFKTLVNAFGGKWLVMWNSMYNIAKDAINKIIALFMGMVESVKFIFEKISSVAQTMWTTLLIGPAAFTQNVRDKLFSELNPVNLAVQFTSKFTKALRDNTDYVGAGIHISKSLLKGLEEGFGKLYTATGIELSSTRLVGSILQRAEELRLARMRESAGIMPYYMQRLPDQFVGPLQLATTENLEEAVEELKDKTKELAKAEKERLKLLNELAEAQFEASVSIDEMFYDLERERQVLFMNNTERQLKLNLMDMEKLAYQAGVDDIDRLLERYEAEYNELVKFQKLATIADQVGMAFGNTFQRIIIGAAGVKEALIALYQEIVRIVTYQMIALPISSAISTGISSVGAGLMGISGPGIVKNLPNPFMPGIEPFQIGGVVNQRKLFMYGGSKFGSIGEAGPEAILPLSKTKSGHLGVEVSNASQRVINVHMNVKTVDADSFRRSSRQIIGDLRHAVRGI